MVRTGARKSFYNFSNHHLFGANFRSQTLSLFRYKVWLLEKRLAGKLAEDQRGELEKNLKQMQEIDYRTRGKVNDLPEIRRFWEQWHSHYGKDGLKNARGDRLLTELTLWSMRHLRPRLMMINYNDPDYVHWGNMTHYTEGIKVIDQGFGSWLHRRNWTHSTAIIRSFVSCLTVVEIPIRCSRCLASIILIPRQLMRFGACFLAQGLRRAKRLIVGWIRHRSHPRWVS